MCYFCFLSKDDKWSGFIVITHYINGVLSRFYLSPLFEVLSISCIASYNSNKIKLLLAPFPSEYLRWKYHRSLSHWEIARIHTAKNSTIADRLLSCPLQVSAVVVVQGPPARSEVISQRESWVPYGIIQKCTGQRWNRQNHGLKWGGTDLEAQGYLGEVILPYRSHPMPWKGRTVSNLTRESWWSWGCLYLNPDLILLPCGEFSELQLLSAPACHAHPVWSLAWAWNHTRAIKTCLMLRMERSGENGQVLNPEAYPTAGWSDGLLPPPSPFTYLFKKPKASVCPTVFLQL